ncbi:MAG: A/G-specific adenine glycosylase, partial [Chitinophagales bacterium]
MPWKNTRDPYKIWLSEIILQQTRVEQGLPYYERITKKFPTVNHLANASEDEVLKFWEGLGYYTRARNLHAASKQVVNVFGGKFPDTHEEILKLKGVGPYSAAAIASFAFDLPHAVVDGNVFRLLARYFGISEAV